jgi:hypothetical protein
LYFAPNYSDQVTVIQEIAKRIPLDHILVVKEHPSQPGFLLKQKFSKMRNINSNLYYLPAQIDSKILLELSELVITITGTVGWEALINNKPVMVLGNVFYDKHPKVMRLNNYQEIAKYFKEGLIVPDNDDITIDYLAKMIEMSYEGKYFIKYASDPKNIANFENSIESELKKISNF